MTIWQLTQLHWDGTVTAGTIISAGVILLGLIGTAIGFYTKLSVRLAVGETNFDVISQDIHEIKDSLGKLSEKLNPLTTLPDRINQIDKRIERLELPRR